MSNAERGNQNKMSVAEMLKAAIHLAELGEVPAKVTIERWRRELESGQQTPAVSAIENELERAAECCNMSDGFDHACVELDIAIQAVRQASTCQQPQRNDADPRPSHCPTCGSSRPRVKRNVYSEIDGDCHDPFHKDAWKNWEEWFRKSGGNREELK
jgi:hypothetical protein